MAPPGELSIVIPARNEAAALRSLLPELRQRFPQAEILLVDDASEDETPALGREHGCRVISHPYRIGNGAAVKTGLRAATGAVTALMDGDGQHRPEDLERLLDRFGAGGFDMVVGARSMEGHASHRRWAANGVFNRLASWMTNQRVLDLTSGLRVARTDRLREFLCLMPNGFSYPTTITMSFFRSGYSVDYLPVEVQERAGESHIRPLRDGVRFLLIIFRIGTLYSPLKLFLPVSLVLFALATAVYAYTYASEGRFTNMSALLYSTSLLTFLIGLVSEQITNLVFQIRGR
ncbi:MAG: glycosyltransferase family 2 protein [Gammaproteobacteria bacterium]|nr:glycosyltransferase family 2 protein [Gammaproteobacteria bacterium]